MKTNPAICSCLVLMLLLASGGPVVRGGTLRTQSLVLQKGWNAVFLEVNPSTLNPEDVLAGTPIDVVAEFFAPTSPAQFVTDPQANLFSQAGWAVWYAEPRPDAFLKSLHAIHGQRAYLVHATRDFTWSVSGSVSPPDVRWQPNSFNLVGFGVDRQAPPTFAQFFGGSRAHQHNRIYRLEQGSWRRVSDPAAERMRAGEAYWIYSEGGSKFQGPLRVEMGNRWGLALAGGKADLILRNDASQPLVAEIEHVVAGGDPVPLSVVVRAVGTRGALVRSLAVRKPAAAWTQSLPSIPAGSGFRVPLEARLEEMSSPKASSLLRISTDLGAEIWLPVAGFREDLEIGSP